MANLGNIKLGIPEVLHDCTLTVRLKGIARWRVRLWMAKKLIELAGRIAQFGHTVIEEV